MTINSPAAILLAMYVAAAEKVGTPRAALGGTIQNDILKEYQAQKEYVFPLVRRCASSRHDAFLHRRDAEVHTISVSGYHIREAARPPLRSSPSRWRTASPTSRRL